MKIISINKMNGETNATHEELNLDTVIIKTFEHLKNFIVIIKNFCEDCEKENKNIYVKMNTQHERSPEFVANGNL